MGQIFSKISVDSPIVVDMLSLACLIVSVALFGYIFIYFFYAWTVRNYLPSNALITRFKSNYRSIGKKWLQTFEVKFQFTVDGVEYFGSTFHVGNHWKFLDFHDEIYAVEQAFEARKMVVIFYDPLNPKSSLMISKIDWKGLAMLLCIAIVGIMVFLYNFQS